MKRDKIIYLLIGFAVLIIILNIRNALADDIISYQFGKPVDLKVQCINNNTYCSASGACNITILYPNNSVVVTNALMTNKGAYHNYTLSSTKTLINGRYSANAVCLDGTSNSNVAFYFDITPNGFKGLLGFYFLALILSYGLVVFGIWRGDMIFAMLGSLGLFSMGLFILFNGLDIYKNNLTEAIAIITLGVAMYVSARTGIEYLNNI